jgi:fibronectin type 3 domain-containing protein
MVSQSGYDLILTWTNPPRYIDGSAATNLSRVQILINGAPVATVNVAAAGKPQSYAIPVGPVLAGQRTFSLVVETAQGKMSEISNSTSITPVVVPGRVARLDATPDQRRIFLKWEKPKDGSEFAHAYIVMRTDTPADAETVTETHSEDVRYQTGKTLTYQVTAVRRMDGGMVMGVGPESVTVLAEDKTPPKVPSGIEIQISDMGAYVTWAPNDEADLAGYRVFRSEHAESGFRVISDRIVLPNGFFDASYKPGSYYGVSAVDEFGNESRMSTPFRGP